MEEMEGLEGWILSRLARRTGFRPHKTVADAILAEKIGCSARRASYVSFTPAMPEPKHTNALIHEKSPYLLQHAHNPVDWMPWGEAAFEKARQENKPIFLSIGYSTCHWCHVMEHESFENEETRQVLNEHFVSVKVDREERPDVDLTYMTYVQATSGHGGWPHERVPHAGTEAVLRRHLLPAGGQIRPDRVSSRCSARSPRSGRRTPAASARKATRRCRSSRSTSATSRSIMRRRSMRCCKRPTTTPRASSTTTRAGSAARPSSRGRSCS